MCRAGSIPAPGTSEIRGLANFADPFFYGKKEDVYHTSCLG